MTVINLVFVLLLSFGLMNADKKEGLYDDLQNYLKSRVNSYDKIDTQRKEDLGLLAKEVFDELAYDGKCDVTFICTHNSRRSHIAQLWFHTAAVYYDVEGIHAFSGGVEATAFHKNAIAALERAGVNFTKDEDPENKGIVARIGKDLSTVLHFSKKYNHRNNPQKNFFAVMVCSDADKSCPVVEGADFRIALPYDDPRYFDDTPAQDGEYDKTVSLIAREMFFVMNEVKRRQIQMMESHK